MYCPTIHFIYMYVCTYLDVKIEVAGMLGRVDWEIVTNVEVNSNSVTAIPSFVKISRLIHRFKGRTQTLSFVML
jgi:hypothetical protein